MQPPAFPLLSTQERRVVAYAIRGLGDKQIAQAMQIAVETVRTYWVRIREKSGGATRAEIIAGQVQALAQESIDALEQQNAVLEAEVRRREIAEAQLRGILDSMPLGAYFADPTGRFVYVNRAWAETMGVPYEAALAFDAPAHIHPDEREAIVEGFRRSVEAGTGYSFECRLIRDDGSLVWIRVRSAPVRLTHGETIYVGTMEDVTHGREQEEAVRRREAELRALADLMPQIVMMADERGLIQFVNAWGVRYFGRDLERFRHGRWVEDVHPDDAASVRLFATRTPVDLGPMEQEIRIRRVEDGAYRWHLLRMRPGFDDKAQVTRWIALFLDVHDLHEAQERLARNQSMLQDAERIALLGSYVYDPASDRAEWSRGLFEIFGLDAAQGPPDQETFFARVHPDDAAEVRRRLAAWRATGGAYRDEYRIVAPDGRTRTIVAAGDAEETVDGRRVVGSFQDVTQIRIMERELHHKASALQGAADASLDELYILCPLDESGDFAFDFVNRPAEEHFDVPPGGLNGKPMLGTFPCDSVQNMVRILEEVFRTGETYLGEHAGGLRNTVGRWYRVRAARIEGGVAMTVSDITPEKRHAEAQREQMRLLHEAQAEIVLRQRELEEANLRLREQAHIDPLTGLKNKRRFSERVEAEQDLAIQYGHRFAVLTIDVDRLREINDAFGHAVGDRTIEDVATILRHGLHSNDFVARLGGGQFAALVLETDPAEAQAIAERLRYAVERRPWAYPVTVSVGVACCLGDVPSAEGIADRSLRVLGEAKRAGRNRVAVEDPVESYKP